jgi:hypothetical protein
MQFPPRTRVHDRPLWSGRCEYALLFGSEPTTCVALRRHGIRGRSIPPSAITNQFLIACRSARCSAVRRPRRKLPFFSPRGPPEPRSPPCILHRARPLTAACLHGRPDLVFAPHPFAFAKFASRRATSASRMGLIVIPAPRSGGGLAKDPDRALSPRIDIDVPNLHGLSVAAPRRRPCAVGER